jgi:periplasmic divalent cation tolerance protein
MPASAVLCLITAPPAEAEKIAAEIVERELAACVNVVTQVRSVYRWQGAVQRDEESLLLAKTTSAAIGALERLLDQVHPYDTFEFIVLDITAGSAPYLEWIAASTASPL